MFAVIVTGKTSIFAGLGKTEQEAVQDLLNTRLAFVARRASTVDEIHNYFKKYKWYEKCKLIAPDCYTVWTKESVTTTFPLL